MVVLVTGASGQLGQAISSVSAKYPQVDFRFASSTEADVTDKQNLHVLFNRIKPDFCINAAAYTAVDKAESETEKAFAINVTGAQNLATVCQEFHTVLIHISTDFVFDGNKSKPYSEEDATNPQGVYGATKRQGEEAIAAVFDDYITIRTSWLYSEFGNNFMKTMLKLAKDRPALNVVNDQRGTPTYAPDLAQAVLDIIISGKKAFGTYHYSNEGEATWYDFAAKIFENNQVRIDLKPIPSSDYPTPAKRPAYSVLDKTKIKETFGIQIPHWQESLEKIKPGSF